METTALERKKACREELVEKAGKLALHYYREEGFHCPEATIRAVSDTLGLNLPEDVIRSASGFMGGGGGMGERCGVLEAGCMIMSFIFGRVGSFQEPWPNNHLIRVMHSRFMEKLSCVRCQEITANEDAEGIGPDTHCNRTVYEGAKIVAGVIFDADDIFKAVTPADYENDPKPFE